MPQFNRKAIPAVPAIDTDVDTKLNLEVYYSDAAADPPNALRVRFRVAGVDQPVDVLASDALPDGGTSLLATVRQAIVWALNNDPRFE